ncbi:Gfo/Idh/MocA family oxidoreductase [Saprospiraceae bacterium]|nr:Gfo/Idh/MocA family oxidoreductase [Saprospiraceae bacterium]MDB4824885.1 Gfo/Idh/MocA family oxidoreductase [Saprospiraceae bacterium]
MIIRHEKVKAGIIGWGKNTLLLADLLTRYAKNIELVALSTSYDTGRDYAIRNLGIKHIFTHHKQMMDLHEIDAVIIAGPGEEHTEQIIDSLKAGYHTLYELPAALDIFNAIKIVDAVEHYPSQIAMGALSHRYDSKYKKIKEKIQSGAIGNLIAIEVYVNQFRDNKILKTDSGIVRDMLLSQIDLVRWITGQEIISVSSNRVGEGINMTYAHFTASLEGGQSCTFTANRQSHQPHGSSIKIIGSDLEIYFRAPIETYEYAEISNGQLTPTSLDHDNKKEYMDILNAFLYTIQEKVKPNDTVKDIMSNTRTTLAFEKSLGLYGPVEIEL